MSLARIRPSGHYLGRRVAGAGLARGLAALSALMLAAGFLVYRLGGVDFPALEALFGVVLMAALVALVLAVFGLVQVWRRGDEGGGVVLGALALALLVAAPFGLAAVLAERYPDARVAETDGMLAADIVAGATLSQALAGDPAASGADLAPLPGRRFPARAAQVYTIVRTVIADEGWSMTDVVTQAPEEADDGDLGVSGSVDIPLPTARSSVDIEAAQDPFVRPESSTYTLFAVATGPILALPSDVTIRIVEDGAETFVDLRSASRLGDRDLGQNQRFIEAFLAALDTAMTGIATVVPAR